MRLVIKGSEWGRGIDGDGLYDGKGRYCCLGLHARACGVSPDEMEGLGMPSRIDHVAPDDYVDAWLEEDEWDPAEADDNERAEEAARINDELGIHDDERIALLRPLFKEVGVTLVWRPDL